MRGIEKHGAGNWLEILEDPQFQNTVRPNFFSISNDPLIDSYLEITLQSAEIPNKCQFEGQISQFCKFWNTSWEVKGFLNETAVSYFIMLLLSFVVSICSR